MSALDPENAVRCPYMAEHVMHIDSLLTHLNRCKATNKHLFKSCIYNSLHVVLRKDYKDHLKNCQDRFSKGGIQDDEWDGRQKPKIEKYDRQGNDSNYSSSHDDEDSISFHSSNNTDFSFSNTQASSLYRKNDRNDQRIRPQSFNYGSETKKLFSKQQSVERNISLDFSFRKDNNTSNLSNQKVRRGTTTSQKDTCESNYDGCNKSFVELTMEEKNDYDEVMELIQGIDQSVKMKKFEKKKDVLDKLGDDLIEVCMRKGERINNEFFHADACNMRPRLC